jgi:hypothetical protein
LQNTLSELGEELAAKLLPYIDAVANALIAAVPRMAEFAATISDAFSVVSGFVSEHRDLVVSLAAGAAAALVAVQVFKVITAVTKAWAIAQGVLNGTIALNPIGVAVVAIAALVAAFVLAYQKSETFRKVVDAVGSVLKDVLVVALDAVKTAIGFVVGVVTGLGDKLLFLLGPVGAIIYAFRNWDEIKAIVGKVFDFVTGLISKALSKIGELVKKGLAAVLAFFVNAGKTIGEAVLKAVTFWVSVYSFLPRKALAAVSSLFGLLTGFFSRLFSAISERVRSGIDAIVGFFKSLPSRLASVGSAMFNAGKALIGRLFDGLQALGSIAGGVASNLMNAIVGPINSGIQAVNNAIPNSISFKGIGIDLPDNPFPTIPMFAKGGVVDRAVLGIVGEAGPEAIIPLTKPARAATLIAQSGLANMLPVQAAVLSAMANESVTVGGGSAMSNGVQGSDRAPSPVRLPAALRSVAPGPVLRSRSALDAAAGRDPFASVPSSTRTVNNYNTFNLPNGVTDLDVLASMINNRASAFAER